MAVFFFFLDTVTVERASTHRIQERKNAHISPFLLICSNGFMIINLKKKSK